MNEFLEAQAMERARPGDNLVSLVTCPCCESKLAIYYQLNSRVEIVLDTTDAKPQPLPE